MFTLHNLRIVRVLPKDGTTFVFAKYPGSFYEHSFLVEPAGGVKTMTISGVWVELREDAGLIIRQKLKSFLTSRDSRSARSLRKFIRWSRKQYRKL